MPERKWKGPDWVTAIATALIFVTTVVYTTYAKKQWQEMEGSGKQTDQLIYLYRQQLAELQKQALDTHELAESTGKQASQTELLAKRASDQATTTKIIAEQAKVSADIARDALTKTSRPWIWVDGPLIGAAIVADPVEISHPTLYPDQSDQTQVKTRITLTIKNFGEGPAFFVTSFGGIVPATGETDPQKLFAQEGSQMERACRMADLMRDTAIIPKEKGSGPTLFPNDTNPMDIGGTTIAPGWDLSSPLLSFGCVSYRDQFFVSHHAKMCFESATPISQVAKGQGLMRCNYFGAD